MISTAAPDLLLARELILAHSWNFIAYQILNLGIRHWFSARRDAVVGYVTCHGIRVVAGAPVCSPARIAAIAEKYKFRPHYSEVPYAVVNDARFHPINVFAIAHAFAGSPLQLFAWRTLKKNFQRVVRR